MRFSFSTHEKADTKFEKFQNFVSAKILFCYDIKFCGRAEHNFSVAPIELNIFIRQGCLNDGMFPVPMLP